MLSVHQILEVLLYQVLLHREEAHLMPLVQTPGEDLIEKKVLSLNRHLQSLQGTIWPCTQIVPTKFEGEAA
jgi:hypothetical protein